MNRLLISMRSAVAFVSAIFLPVIGGLLSAPRALATEWRICNSSSEDASVAIVFSLNDNRHYIAKGWWNIPANGACRVVFSGDLPVKGAYLRAEGSRC
jgi:uncharacterized membrane protein